MAARVEVPSASSTLIELCRLAAPWKAVKCTMKAKPRTRMFFTIRHFSPRAYSVRLGFTSTNCDSITYLQSCSYFILSFVIKSCKLSQQEYHKNDDLQNKKLRAFQSLKVTLYSVNGDL